MHDAPVPGAAPSRCCSLRLPSLVQPMGPDQGLYAYVGERILARRAALSRRLGSEAAGDPLHLRRRCARSGRATPSSPLPTSPPRRSSRLLLVGSARRSGRPLAGGRRRRCSSCCCRTRRSRGSAASGVRAQCETFIAVAVAGALLLLAARPHGADRRRRSSRRRRAASALAFALKYNAAVYARRRHRRALWLMSGLTVAARRCASPPGSRRPGRGLFCGVRARRRARPISTRRRSSTTCSTRAKPTPGRWTCARYLLAVPDRARAGRCAVARRRRRLRSCCWRVAFAQRDAPRSPSSGWQRPACRSRSTAAAACRSTSCRRSRRWRWRPALAAR